VRKGTQNSDRNQASIPKLYAELFTTHETWGDSGVIC